MQARFVHVNVIARDWRALADFYIRVFGCTPVPPERHLGGEALERGTGLSDVRLNGIHLRLPGDPFGPTLEIFQYSRMESRLPAAVNRPGFGHLAFRVDDVAAAREAVLAGGGRTVGDIVTTETGDGRRITWVYVTDPEGNIVELQSSVE